MWFIPLSRRLVIFQKCICLLTSILGASSTTVELPLSISVLPPARGSLCCPTEIWLSRTIYVTGTMASVLPVMTSHTGGCDQQCLEDGSWAGIRL